jgi:hypothetical protein
LINDNYFNVADFGVKISFLDSDINNMFLLQSFIPFKSEKETVSKLLFSITVDDNLHPVNKERRERIRSFDTGNGDTIVDAIDDGGYQYIIKDINGKDCCLLITNKDFSSCRCALNGTYQMRSFGLNNALMMVFAFAGSYKQALLMHASTVRNGGFGYAFIAKSGTGKSTQTASWLKYIPGSDLMNDDNPIIRIIDDTPYIYGSPWSGKTPCYRNIKAPLGAITRIDRAKHNSVEQLAPATAFVNLLPACSSMIWDTDIYRRIGDTITKIIETTNIYILHCLPDKEAAMICQKTISR